MTEALHLSVPAPDEVETTGPLSDAELIARVRAGESAAYEELFLRHRDVALRYARRLVDRERADDLCAEAFTKIFDLLQRGKGPDIAFRAYLLTTVRTSHLNSLRTVRKEHLVPDHEPLHRMAPVLDDPDARFDREAVFRAFSTLPERWQVVLWLTSVEGLSPEEASDHLGLKPNAIASLAFRARAGLRQAYLSEHLLDSADPICRANVDQLPAFVRGRVTPRRKRQVEEHLAHCASCAAAMLEIGEVDHSLGAVVGPMALAGITTGGAVAASSGLLASLKGAGTTLYGALAAKTAAVVTVATIGAAAVTTQIGTHDDPGPSLQSDGQTSVVQGTLAQGRPALVQVLAPATDPALPAPDSGSQQRATGALPLDPAAAEAPDVAPATPVDPETPTPDPTPEPTPGPTPGPTPAPPSAGPRFGTATSRAYTDQGARWDEVTVPVEHPVPGTRVDFSTRRTLGAENALTAGTGWVCGIPQASWLDGGLLATTTISCVYGNSGSGGPIVLRLRTVDGARLSAEMTPPRDIGSLVDQLLTLDLRP